MSLSRSDWRNGVLAFTVVVEIATALVLFVVPSLVVSLLLGQDADAAVRSVARCFGVVLGLAIRCGGHCGGDAPAAG